MSTATESYRTSHVGQGQDYHARFSENPRRSLIWSIEQQLLSQICDRHLGGRDIDYLDFACGTGRILSFLESRMRSATGVDVSDSMLALAGENVQHAELVKSDITTDNVLRGRKFDLITAFRFFPNAESTLRMAVMSELVQLVRDDGFIVFNNHRSTSSLRSRLARIATVGKRGNGGMSPHAVVDLLDECGLEIVKIYHAGVVPEWERLLIHPRAIVNGAERLGASLPLSWLAEDLLYVCQKKN